MTCWKCGGRVITLTIVYKSVPHEVDKCNSCGKIISVIYYSNERD